MAFGNEIRTGSSGQSTGFYNGVINQSLRLRVDANYKLDRQMVTPTSVTGTICTASWWMKKTRRGTVQSFIQCRDNQSSGEYAAYWTYGVPTSGDITGTDHHSFRSGGAESIIVGSLNSHRPYDDPNAWYHVVIRYDSTQSTAADRIRIYKNGELQNGTFQGTTYPSQNATETYRNNAGEHLILFGNGEDSGDSFDGYIAEFNWVDGQSLAPETFGESKNGIWIPKKITLSTADYGLNGSRYTFADSSDIGKDTSGVGNDLDRVSNISASDVVPDSPENSFSILNTRTRLYNTSSYFDTGGLRHVSNSTGVTSQGHSSLAVRQDAGGKWYAECRLNAFTNGSTWIGVCRDVPKLSNGLFVAATRSNGYAFKTDGNKTTSDNNGSSYGNSYTAGDVIGIALDLDNNQIFFYKNGTIQNSGTAAFTSISALNFATADTTQHFAFGADTDPGNNFTFNFGQDSTFNGTETAGGNSDANGIGDFLYTVPSGYLALCTSNLPDVTIGPDSDNQAEDFMNTIEYTSDNIGAGGTQNVTGVGFQPDWVWIKNLSSNSTSHTIYDSNRGTGRHISSDNTSAEVGPNSIYGYLSAFGADGFTLTGGTTNANYINQSTDVYVAWNWKANGGTTTTNDASATGVGSIDSVIQANTAAGFSIVSYTGTGSEAQIAHGLNQAPEYVIIKNRSTSSNGQWVIGDNQSGFTSQMYFDQGAASTNAGSFGDTAPNATVVNVNTDNTTNESGDDFIMYCFHSVEGYSKIGKWVGNAVADGPFVYTGFRPQWILIKDYSAGSRDWTIVDDTRFGVGQTNQRPNPIISNINPNDTNKEFDSVSYPMIDFLSNGFKVVIGGTGSTIAQNLNKSSSNSYLYLAFADSPTKFANGF